MGFSQPTNITFGAPSWMLEFILRFQLRSSPKTGATVLRRNISTRTTFALAWPCLHGSKKRQQQWVKKGLYMAYKPLTIPWMHIRPRSWRPSMWWSLHCWDLGGGSHAMPCHAHASTDVGEPMRGFLDPGGTRGGPGKSWWSSGQVSLRLHSKIWIFVLASSRRGRWGNGRWLFPTVTKGTLRSS